MIPGRARQVGLWLLVPTLVFGMFVGLLLTWHHDTELYGMAAGELIGCSESAEVSCNAVNTSAWSELLGIPLATWSFGAHATVLALVAVALAGRDGARTLVLMAGTFAVGASAFLFYVSKVELGFVCAWCLRLYAVNALIFLLPLLGGMPPLPERRLVGLAAGGFAAALALSAVGERVFRATLFDGPAPALAQVAEDRGLDPEGTAPALSVVVRTEDDRDVVLQLHPDDAWKGNREATVSVVEFADLECPYCKRMSTELARLEATYGDRVLFVFKHFPMDPACNDGVRNRKHPDACYAARGAYCAGEQQAFWRFHDMAFKNQHDLTRGALHGYAEAIGLDVDAFKACLVDSRSLEAVERDGAVGKSLDIHGTPRIYIDGKLYRAGSSAEVMARAIEEALGADPRDAASSAAKLRDDRTVPGEIPAGTPAMREVSHGGLAFSIDTFEASIQGGAAVSSKAAVPAFRTTWYQAKEACEAAGKRLCSEEEWVTACQGARAVDDDGDREFADDRIEGTAYPYGDLHDPQRCWDARPQDVYRPVYTGEMPACVTADGVYDMTGNVEEWAGTSPETAVLLGGAWDTTKDHAGCYRRNDRFGPGFATKRTGFRCCTP